MKTVRGSKDDGVLDSICQLLRLKYLSLRGTDVTKLPKKMDRLQLLETRYTADGIKQAAYGRAHPAAVSAWGRKITRWGFLYGEESV